MVDSAKAQFESRMLIDGKLVDGQAGTFTNINPTLLDEGA
jgi:aldehyde dehydrogenase (NAD+)